EGSKATGGTNEARVAFSPRKQSERQGETDSEGSKATGGTNEARVAFSPRKRSERQGETDN
ncbi:MAG: hypothetical protein UC961_04285, partial [Emergencia sp.]|nr:hypothetical protein [Emergencia sp.]